MTINTAPACNGTETIQMYGGLKDPMIMPCYKLTGRFAYIQDAVEILKRLRGTGSVIVDPSTFMITISFICDWDVVMEVVEDLKQGPDLHVFIQSLKLTEDYDGERDGMFS